MIRKLLIAAALLTAAAPAAAQPGQEHAQAAREVLEASRTREGFVRGFELGMASQMAAGDSLPAEVVATIRRLFEEHFRWDEMEPEFIRMYTELYTVDELRQLAAFYRTPVGQKLADTSPELAVRTQAIVNARIQEMLPALMEAITAQVSGAP
ncbi:MAG TPA: DUF2059 domain-containing protein [Longimicrobium sp.]|nr:DUF2059 domain-containing protein [Longimicrobium sp.]